MAQNIIMQGSVNGQIRYTSLIGWQGVHDINQKMETTQCHHLSSWAYGLTSLTDHGTLFNFLPPELGLSPRILLHTALLVTTTD